MIEPDALKLLAELPKSERPIWLNPLSMGSKTNNAWDDGKLDEARILLAEKVDSVGIRFVHPEHKWFRMDLAAHLVRKTGATVVLRFDPWEPNSKGTEPFPVSPFGERHIARLEWVQRLAEAWRRALGDTPVVILLNHEPEGWRHAGPIDVRARLGEMRDVLLGELPKAELSWYNNQQQQYRNGPIWPFIPVGLSDQFACSLYYTDVLRANETKYATQSESDGQHLTTWHTFDTAWAYENAAKPWGERKWLPFTGERAEIYHHAVGKMVRHCHACVAYSPKITVYWLRGLRAFIGGMG